jgi:hypothetical protein
VARGGDGWSRLAQAGPLLLILGSAFTAPLFTAGALTLTGDRLLGLAALGVATSLGVASRLRWTPIHTALAVFVGIQVLTSLLNAAVWPQGVKFVTVYVLGLACFCLAAEWSRSAEGQRRFGTWWITIGAGLGLIGTVVSVWANLSQELVWGTGLAQMLWFGPPNLAFASKVFAGKATFGEWNLFSSFLLIPLTLGLWRWPRDTHARWLTASLGAVVFGLAFGLTRAAWLSMAGIIALWWWARRPKAWQLTALGAMLVLAFLLQAAVTSSPVPRGVSWRQEEVLQSQMLMRQPLAAQHARYVADKERSRIRTGAKEEKRPLTQLEWRRLEQLTYKIRLIDRAIQAEELSRIRTGAKEEKRPLTQLEEQRIEQLTDEIRRIDRAIQEFDSHFSTRDALADWSTHTALADRFRASAISSRLLEPVKTGVDANTMGRLAISRVTIESWLRRPVVGHGAGSINRLSVVLLDGQRLQKIWNGNLVLFVLHDSGLVGLAALLGLAVAVWRRGARAISRGAAGATLSLAVPLLAVGGALCFAYQFTHALWLMYPYVYLGLLTGATDDDSSRECDVPGPAENR